jgi:plastocyanin
MRVRCLGIGVLFALLVQAATALAVNQTVTATPSNTFSPSTVTINTGEMVTWNNGGGFHNVHFEDNSFIQPPSPSSAAWSVSRTFTSPGVFRYFCDAHAPTMRGTVSVNGPGFVRPAGATPLRASLALAYKVCQAASANRTHGPALAHPSCNPPAQESDWLTVGTPDANGPAANSIGSVRLSALPGDAATGTDEADFQIVVSITDVRNKSGLTDYTGEVEMRLSPRLTDRNNSTSPSGPFTETGTVSAFNFPVTVPCAATQDNTAVGSTCSVTTSADAVNPGAVPETKRSIWELGKIDVFDGGSDGDVQTPAGNTRFMTQAVFVP